MLEINLLGRFELCRDGKPIEMPSRPSQSLLAYLVLNAGVQHRREKLAGLLWPDSDEKNARSNLRHALWRLRKAIGEEFFITDKVSICFNNKANYQLDVDVLEDETSRMGSIKKMIHAVSVYEGELLPGFYGEWVTLDRERLSAVFEDHIQLLLDRLVEEGQWREVLKWGERWISLGRSPEPAYRALMQAHGAMGDLSGVAATYQRCTTALLEELGVEPSKETHELYERLSTGEKLTILPAEKPHHNLPSLPTPFIGRVEELGAIATILDEPSCRLLTITGPGGIGKTRLALRAAEDKIGTYNYGVFFVPLAPASSAEHFFSAVADALDVTFFGQEDPKVQLINFMRERELLLIMDNLEHLLEGAIPISEFLEKCPRLKILATSRERLNLHAERTFEVYGMQFPESYQDETIENYDAVQLILESARRVDANFSIAEEEKSCAIRICELTGGIPLGLELAAAWVSVLSCSEIAQEIERNLDFLESSLKDLPDRHRSMRAVFDHSWNLLSSPEREVFQKLSIFRGGFSREAADQVANASIPLLARLADKSMLIRNASGRYEIHELLRQFVLAKLDEEEGTEQVSDRHLDYFLTLAENAEIGLQGPEQVEWLNRIEIEHDNLRQALRWSLRKEEQAVGGEGTDLPSETGLRLAGALGQFWDTRGYVNEGRKWLESALEKWRAPSEARVKALTWAGALAERQTDTTRWFALLDESLKLSQELVYKPGVAEALFRQARVARFQGNDERAEKLGLESLKLWRELNDKRGIARALGPLAARMRDQYEYAQASELFEESLSLFREVGDTREIAGALWNLSDVALRRCDFDKAEAFAHESLALYLELGDKHGIATLLRNLGEVTRNSGDPERATDLFEESTSLFQELGDKHCKALSLIGLGRASLSRGDIEDTKSCSEQSLDLFRVVGDDNGASLSHDLRGRAELSEGEGDRAVRSFLDGISIQEELGNKSSTASLLEGLASASILQGKPELAARLWGAVEIIREVIASPLLPIDRERYDHDMSKSLTALGEEVFESLKSEGRNMSMEQAIELALVDSSET
jgi:predicted ATPase/DNA-binding SARP family transcriptional activator